MAGANFALRIEFGSQAPESHQKANGKHRKNCLIYFASLDSVHQDS